MKVKHLKSKVVIETSKEDYYDLVNSKPEQERFLFGWFKRAISI